ncbi:MAG: hypothetical protein K8W52_20950, partial [Deltaproteobacteria bacterium]|nr:hypothetical protein [Deltaproteobacteria bacterium]
RAAIAAHDQPAAEAALARAVAAGADGTLTAPLRAELGPASPRVAVGSPDAPPARPTRAFVVGEVAIARGAQAAPDPGARILLRDRLAAVMPTAASSLDPASAGADAIPITATGSIRTSATAKGTRSTCAITLTAAPGGALIRGEAQTDWDTLPSEDLERDQRECLGSVIDSALRDAIIPKLP